MKPSTMLLAFLAGAGSVSGRTAVAANTTTTPLSLHNFTSTPTVTAKPALTTLTTFATVIITALANIEDRDVAEAEKKGPNCMTTSYSTSGNWVITVSYPYLKGCVTRPAGAIQNVGFHG